MTGLIAIMGRHIGRTLTYDVLKYVHPFYLNALEERRTLTYDVLK